MKIAYRIGRAVLAATALIALALFAGWHVLVWRMGEVYRSEGGVTHSSRFRSNP